MAFLILTTGKCRTLSAEKARSIESVKNGTVRGTREQREYAKSVRKIYFAREPVSRQPVVQGRLPYKDND